MIVMSKIDDDSTVPLMVGFENSWMKVEFSVRLVRVGKNQGKTRARLNPHHWCRVSDWNTKTNTIGGNYKYQILRAISYSKGWGQLQQPNTEIYFKLQMPWSYVNSQVFLAVNLVFVILCPHLVISMHVMKTVRVCDVSICTMSFK